jgi:protein gp37
MGDLFHESVPFEWIDKIIDVIRWNKQHTFQILTKRPERMKGYFTEHVPDKYYMENGNYLDNLWLGVTSENQEQANKRIPILLLIPAVKRFVSCEPLLSEIDFHQKHNNYFQGVVTENNGEIEFYGAAIHWVIAGPETGHNARPMQKEWIKGLQEQCKSAKVPFFDKKNTLGLNLTQIPE